MQYIKWFEEIDKDDISTAGGKGANLGEMVSMHMPVPEGFVVTTHAFDLIMGINSLGERIREEIRKCDVNNTKQLINTSEKIKKMILEQEMPPDIGAEILENYTNLSIPDQTMDKRSASQISEGKEMVAVAVRSSATAEDLPTASFAGQQATFLNIKGNSELLDAVKRCWASLYEPRAIFYRAKNRVEHASIAVIVQRMINSEKSGIMFTVNPTTGEDVIVVEAIWGLGELIVSGRVMSDYYIVSKGGKILQKKIGKKSMMQVRDHSTGITSEVKVRPEMVEAQVLTDDELKKVAYFGRVLEEHYGVPQDIEFAVERGLIKILQTRPVTTRGKKMERKIEGKELLKGLSASPGIASGKVKIVLKMDDITKIEGGMCL